MVIYARLIDKAIECIVDEPRRPAIVERPDLGIGVRSMHMAFAATRRAAASHLIYFVERSDDRGTTVVVLRVFHEAMEPRRRLMQATRRPD